MPPAKNPKSSPTPAPVEEKRLTITEVAARLKKRYAKARDLMLMGKLGATQKEGRTLTVPLSGVEAYEKDHVSREN